MNYNQEISEFIKKNHHPLIQSILLKQNNEIVAEQYFDGGNATTKRYIKSIAKSITSIAAGICIDRGFIKSVDDPIANYLPEFAEHREMFHHLITVKHLLTMSSRIYWAGGVHYHCPMLHQLRASNDWIDYIADIAMKFYPGTKHVYKEIDIILLGEVIARASGKELYTFIEENLYAPLGIESEHWYNSSSGVSYSIGGGKEEEEMHSNLTTRDLAKIGELYLHDGLYNGQQIISQEYIKQCVAPSQCDPGYGYMWWIGPDWYGCRGYGGQNVTVFPKQNAVFVMQATPTPRAMAYNDVFEYVRELITNPDNKSLQIL